VRYLLLALALPGGGLAACGDSSDGGGAADSGPDAGTPEPVESSVVLNEVDVHGRDWVELVNTSADEAVPLGGWVLSDDLDEEGHRYALPADLEVGPAGRVVVKSAKDDGDGEGFPFGLKSGETVTLLDASGGLVAQVELGEVPDERTWGRVPDTVGGWQVTSPTQGEPNSEPVDLDVWLFDPESVAAVDLTVPQEGLDALADTPDGYVQGELTLSRGGQSLQATQVGVRLKGGLSFRPIDAKASFKLSFDVFGEGRRFAGLEKLTLNAMVQDPSMLREAVGYRFFREQGVPAARTGYATVSVNGEPYGLYLVLEAYDETALSLRFGSTRHLYEGTGDLNRGKAAESFEVDEGPDDDLADLEALIRAATGDEDDAVWLQRVEEVLDLDGFVDVWAVEATLGHRDVSVPAANNYYLHSDDAGRFTMLPSGLDEALVAPLGPEDATSRLAARCAAIDACRLRYEAASAGLVGITLRRFDVQAWAAKLAGVIAPHVAADPRRPCSEQEHEEAVAALRAYLGQVVDDHTKTD